MKADYLLELTWWFLAPIFLVLAMWACAGEPIRLYPGYVTKVVCEGRLLISAVGDDKGVRLEPLPKELGCAVLLKPLSVALRTNLILETSVGVHERLVEILPDGARPSSKDLRIELGEAR